MIPAVVPNVESKLDSAIHPIRLGDFKCICGRVFSNRNSYASHTKFCKIYCENARRDVCKSNLLEYNKVSWNKGLHNDYRCVKHKDLFEFLKSNNINYFQYDKKSLIFLYKTSRDNWRLFIELNDDGSLGKKIENKLGPNSWGHGIPCDLSVDDILLLMKDAGIKSSDWSRGNYDLSRHNDEGLYSKLNCKFIRHVDNIHEIYDK